MKKISPMKIMGLCAGVVWAVAEAGNIEGSRPNIILVMTDDQGWSDTGYNGHPVLRTPHLDQMAEEGIRFERFYAGAPVCSPTHGADGGHATLHLHRN